MQTVSTNIRERMGRSQELSEFQRGTTIATCATSQVVEYGNRVGELPSGGI